MEGRISQVANDGNEMDNDSDIVELNTINDTDNSANTVITVNESRQALASSSKTYISSPSLVSEDSNEEVMLWELGNDLLALSAPSLNPGKGGKLPNEKKLSMAQKRINENNKNFTVVRSTKIKKKKGHCTKTIVTKYK